MKTLFPFLALEAILAKRSEKLKSDDAEIVGASIKSPPETLHILEVGALLSAGLLESPVR
jgi:hypothetical protein